MSGPNAGAGLLGVTTVGTTGWASDYINLDQGMMAAFQTRTTSGLATVTVDVQVSNIPGVRDNYASKFGANSPFIRDDSYASLDWVTVSTNYVTTTPASRMDVVPYTPHRVARVRLTSAGVNVPTTLVYVRTWAV
jgi:hypothetical protein